MRLSGLVFLSALVLGLTSGYTQNFSDVPGAKPAAPFRLPPDVGEIVSMVQAGAPEQNVLEAVKASPTLYELTPAQATELGRLGVSQKVIAAMRAHDRALQKQWKRGGTAAAAKDLPPADKKVLSPKVRAGQLDTPMRTDDRPVLRLPPPPKQTNAPETSIQGRPWTSKLISEQAPPPPQLERRPTRPGADYVWISGHWAPLGTTWQWEPGGWAKRPSPGAVWMDGKWEQHARGWIWVPGSWK